VSSGTAGRADYLPPSVYDRLRHLMFVGDLDELSVKLEQASEWGIAVLSELRGLSDGSHGSPAR